MLCFGSNACVRDCSTISGNKCPTVSCMHVVNFVAVILISCNFYYITVISNSLYNFCFKIWSVAFLQYQIASSGKMKAIQAICLFFSCSKKKKLRLLFKPAILSFLHCKVFKLFVVRTRHWEVIHRECTYGAKRMLSRNGTMVMQDFTGTMKTILTWRY